MAVNTGTRPGVALTSQPSNITYSGGNTDSPASWPTMSSLSGRPPHKVPVSFADVYKHPVSSVSPPAPLLGDIPGFESRALWNLGIGTNRAAAALSARFWACPDPSESSGASHWVALWNPHAGTELYGAGSAATSPMRQIGSSAGTALSADSSLPLCLDAGQANAWSRLVRLGNVHHAAGVRLSRWVKHLSTHHRKQSCRGRHPVSVALNRANDAVFDLYGRHHQISGPSSR